MRKATLIIAVTTLVCGCQFSARSPEDYAKDTQTLLESRGAQLKTCYDTVLKTDEAAAGSVVVSFTVEEETGVLKDINADPSSTAPAAVQQCLIQSMQGLQLDPPDAREGQAKFTYVFQFAPRQPATVQPAEPTP